MSGRVVVDDSVKPLYDKVKALLADGHSSATLQVDFEAGRGHCCRAPTVRTNR